MSPTEAADLRHAATARTLRRVPFFAGLSPAALESLAGQCTRRTARRGVAIFREGDPARGFFVLESGVVKVYRTTPDGREVVIHVLGPGDFIGEVPLHAGGTYPATAEATEDSSLLYVPGPSLFDLIRREPDVALRLLEGFATRLLALLERFESLAAKGAAGRLAEHLLRTTRKAGRRTDDGLEIPLPLSRKQLASLIGTSRETVSRTLSAWQRAGLLRLLERGTVVVRDARALEAVR